MTSQLSPSDTEPADPALVLDTETDSSQPTNAARRKTPLAPQQTLDVDLYDDRAMFIDCGCGDCSPNARPLWLTKEKAPEKLRDMVLPNARKTWAKDVCEQPQFVTVAQAGEIYSHYQGKRIQEGQPSKVDDARKQFRQIMDHDRWCRDEYGENLSTAMVSLRCSPIIHTSDGRSWLPPLTIAQWMSESRQTAYERFRYRLNQDFDDWNHTWMIATTDHCATPHVHVYVWVNDGNDELSVDHFQQSVSEHVDGTPTARWKYHPIGTDGEDGAVTVYHSPTIADVDGYEVTTDDGITLDMSSIIEEERRSNDEPYHESTEGALYLGSQLPDWALADKREDDGPTEAAKQGAAIKWASPHNWFGRSQLKS